MQHKVLSAIRRRIHEGAPVPTYRELRDEFGWKSTATVRDHLKALARKGHIELSGHGHRSIRLVDQLAVAAVPLIGRVPAGSPVVAEENIERRIPVPADWTGGGIFFALRITGDSMLGAGIYDGDLVIVREQHVAEDGEIVVATLDGETTVKRLERRGNVVRLLPENERYRPIAVQTDSAIVQGIVVGLLRAYRSRRSRWTPQSGESASTKGRARDGSRRGGGNTRGRQR